jgi:hypothetical protein
MLACVNALSERMDLRDEARNAVIVGKARLALTQRPADVQPAPEVPWLGEAEVEARYAEALIARLEPLQGSLLLSSCHEFPCIFGLELPADAVEPFTAGLSIPDIDALYIKRVGIDDEGGVIQYFGIGSSAAPELAEGGEAVATRVEYRALLLDDAYRSEDIP